METKEYIEYKPWLACFPKSVREIELPKCTAYHLLEENNKNYKDHTSLFYFNQEITFGKFFDEIEKCAKALKNQGVKKGDIVTCVLPTIPETVYIFYALNKIGAIANMIDPRVSAEGIANFVEEVNSEKIFTLDLFTDKTNNAIQKVNRDKEIVNKVIVVSPVDSLPAPIRLAAGAKQLFSDSARQQKKLCKNGMFMKWRDFIEQGKNYTGQTEEEYTENYPAAIVHTGGTTGMPKGVLLSNDSFNAMVYFFKYSGIDIKPGHRFMDIMPPFIAYGLSCGLHMPLCLGMTTKIFPQFDPNKFDKELLSFRPNHFMGVPSHYESLMRSKLLEKEKNWDLSFLISVGVGGDGLDEGKEIEINNWLKKHNCKYRIAKGYGLSEVNSSFCTAINERNEIGCVGNPYFKNDIKVVDPDIENPVDAPRLPIGQTGELYLSTPTMMLEYYNNPEETAKVMIKDSDGTKWIRTGDIGYINEKGNVYIIGRKKQVIIRHDGFKIFPIQIEKVVQQHPAVKACKVVGVKDSSFAHGRLPKVHIILKDDYKSIEKQKNVIEELKLLCYEQLPEYELPVDYQIDKSFPLTAIGKIDFQKMEKDDSLENVVYSDDMIDEIYKETKGKCKTINHKKN